MKAYPVFYLNSDNFIGIVTSETERDEDNVLELFCLHYPEYREDYVERGNIYVGEHVRHVHTK